MTHTLIKYLLSESIAVDHLYSIMIGISVVLLSKVLGMALYKYVCYASTVILERDRIIIIFRFGGRQKIIIAGGCRELKYTFVDERFSF